MDTLTTHPPFSTISDIKNILLADDDNDDCLLFNEALKDLKVTAELTIVYNGEQLMQLLKNHGTLPDVLFLDLNMPRKNGFTCLEEIKADEKLKALPVIALSTSYEPDMADRLFCSGAQHYIKKPNDFSKLTELIHRALSLTVPASTEKNDGDLAALSKDNFVLSH